MFGGIGLQEIIIIIVVGLVVFGATRLPKIARNLGIGIKEFKKSMKGIEGEEEDQERYINPNQGQQYNQGTQYQNTGHGYAQNQAPPGQAPGAKAPGGPGTQNQSPNPDQNEPNHQQS